MAVKNDIFIFGTHFPAMLFEFLTFIAVFLIAIIVFRKWRERRTIATLYLSIALFSIAFAAFVAFTGLFSWFLSWIEMSYMNVYSPTYYTLSLPIGYCLVIPYDIFLIAFSIQIFLDKNQRKIIPFLISGLIIGALLFLPANYWGVDPEPSDPASTRVIVLGLYLLYNTLVYILLAYFAFREAGRTTHKLHRRGFQAIAWGFIGNILVFIFFLLDAILIMLDPSSSGYSIFISFAWITALISSFLFYLGYILPTWFRKRIEPNSHEVKDSS